MTPKLEVSGLGYSYHTMEGETPALSDISFSIEAGEFLAVVGPLRLREIHASLPLKRSSKG